MGARLNRFYGWLGFRRARAQSEWLKNGCGGSAMIFPLSFADRLRVVISGRIEVDLLHRIEPMPKRWETVADFAVLPPNYEPKT